MASIPLGNDFTARETATGTYELIHEPSGDAFAFDGDEASVPAIDADEGLIDELNGIPYPRPGEVQDAIDFFADNNIEAPLRLWPQETYDPDTTLDVKSGVTLDFNGARIEPTTDQDLINVHPLARVVDPIINWQTTGLTFTSTVFVFDTQFGAYNKVGYGISGGRTVGNVGEGTAFYLHDELGEPIVFLEINHDTDGVEKVCEIFAESSGFLNGNIIGGVHEHHTTGIHIHNTGSGETSGNTFKGVLQPLDGGSQRGLFVEQGSRNHFVGYIWDKAKYSTALAEFGPDAGEGNTILGYGTFDHTLIDNNSGDPSNGAIGFSDDIKLDGSSVALGALATFAEAGKQQVAIGREASTEMERAVALGALATTSGTFSAALGYNSSATDQGVAVGALAAADSNNSTSIGANTSVTANGGVAIGANVSVSTNQLCRIGSNQLEFGFAQDTVADADIEQGNGVVEADETTSEFKIRYKDSNGTIQTGAIPFN